jgi:hypothetical protein
MIRFMLAIALVASVSTASAQINEASSGQYVHCHARGCQNTNTYPGRCTGGRKCPGPDERYVNGVLVKRNVIQTGRVICGDRACRRTQSP